MRLQIPLSECLGGFMVALMSDLIVGAFAALILWLMVEPVLSRVLPRLYRVLPRDMIGPDAWLADTVNQTGIFDLASRRRRG